MNGERTKVIVQCLKQIFLEHGIPHILYSDTGPCYSSEEFCQFSLGNGFQHITSSLHFPQSNGFAESLVRTAKATLKKCTLGKCDPDLAFLLLRSTPVSSSLPSPAELLYNRPVRSVLPSATKYRPELESTKSVLAQMHGTIVSATEEPRAYIVQTTEGTRYRRNRRLIRKMPNKSVCTDNGDITDCNIEPHRPTEIPDNCHSRKSHQSVKIADNSQPGLM